MMSKVRQEPELESFQKLVTQLYWGNYVVVALIWQVGRTPGGRVECLGVKATRRRGFPRCKEGYLDLARLKIA